MRRAVMVTMRSSVLLSGSQTATTSVASSDTGVSMTAGTLLCDRPHHVPLGRDSLHGLAVAGHDDRADVVLGEHRAELRHRRCGVIVAT